MSDEKKKEEKEEKKSVMDDIHLFFLPDTMADDFEKFSSEHAKDDKKWETAHKEYIKLFNPRAEEFLKKYGLSVAEFAKMPSHKVDQDIKQFAVDMILSLSSYDAFKALMKAEATK